MSLMQNLDPQSVKRFTDQVGALAQDDRYIPELRHFIWQTWMPVMQAENVRQAAKHNDLQRITVKDVEVAANPKAFPSSLIDRIYGELTQDPNVNATVNTIVRDICNRLRGAEASARRRELEQEWGAMLRPALDNYEGFACARVVMADGTGSPVQELPQQQTVLLQVWMQTSFPDNVENESISVRDGNYSPVVEFDVEAESQTFSLHPSSRRINAPAEGESEIVEFTFHSGKESGAHRVWIQFFQRDSAIQTIELILSVTESNS